MIRVRPRGALQQVAEGDAVDQQREQHDAADQPYFVGFPLPDLDLFDNMRGTCVSAKSDLRQKKQAPSAEGETPRNRIDVEVGLLAELMYQPWCNRVIGKYC